MVVLSRLKRLLWVDVMNPVHSDVAESWIAESGSSKELVDELYGFGGLMLGEVASRTSALEGKAALIVGWSLAVLGVLLAGSPSWINTNSWAVVLGVLAATIGAFVAAVASVMALFVRSWKWPSEVDWFRRELFSQPDRLREYHLLAMLEAHREHSATNIVRGRCLRLAQFALGIATILVGIATLFRVGHLFISGLFPLPQ